MVRHIGKHENLVNKASAKALTTVQKTFKKKGFKLVRMEDIKNIFGDLWLSSDGRKIAYRSVIRLLYTIYISYIFIHKLHMTIVKIVSKFYFLVM
jgi:hypothetical protein